MTSTLLRGPSALAIGFFGLAGSLALAQPSTEMKNLHFRVLGDAALQVETLRGELQPTGKKTITFDEPESFRIHIASAEVRIRPEGLAALMNAHVFAYPEAPIEQLELQIEKDVLEQKGVLHKGVDVPFELEGRLEATAEGDVRYRVTSVQVADVPVQGLMDLFGVELTDLVNARQALGVRIEQDALVLDPERLLPPPAIRGRVRAVRIESPHIALYFGEEGAGPTLTPGRPDAPNYMFFRGGRLKFGKLTMEEADLQIVDLDPEDPFDFFLRAYNRQLVAGYSKNTPDYGLVTYMADYEDLEQQK